MIACREEARGSFGKLIRVQLVVQPLAKVWTLIKLGNFSSWWTKLASSAVGASSFAGPGRPRRECGGPNERGLT